MTVGKGSHLKQGSKSAIFIVMIEERVPSRGNAVSWLCFVEAHHRKHPFCICIGMWEDEDQLWNCIKNLKLVYCCQMCQMNQEHNGNIPSHDVSFYIFWQIHIGWCTVKIQLKYMLMRLLLLCSWCTKINILYLSGEPFQPRIFWFQILLDAAVVSTVLSGTPEMHLPVDQAPLVHGMGVCGETYESVVTRHLFLIYGHQPTAVNTIHFERHANKAYVLRGKFLLLRFFQPGYAFRHTSAWLSSLYRANLLRVVVHHGQDSWQLKDDIDLYVWLET